MDPAIDTAATAADVVASAAATNRTQKIHEVRIVPFFLLVGLECEVARVMVGL